MKRSVKKGCAFLLAMIMLIGTFQVSVYGANMETRVAEQTESEYEINAATDMKYNDAYLFSDSVVLVENGKLADDSDGGASVSTSTKLVFVDGDGRKKTISNDDGNGNKLFDAVFPTVSGGRQPYLSDCLKVVKNGKVSYIKSDGTYYGTDLTYYDYAKPITEELLLVQNNGNDYQIVNSTGTVTYSGLQDVSSTVVFTNYVYVFSSNKTLILNKDGIVVNEYAKAMGPGKNAYSKMNGYRVLDAKDDSEFWLVNEKGEIVKVISEDKLSSVGLNYFNDGYLLYYYSDIDERGLYYSYTKMVDMNTGEVIYVDENYSKEYESGLILENAIGKKKLYSVDGTIYIDDLSAMLSEYIFKNLKFSSFRTDAWLDGENLFVSFYQESDSEDYYTTVLTKENGYKLDESKVYKGRYRKSSDRQYFITVSKDDYIRKLYSMDGTLIKDFGEQTTYKSSGYISKQSYDDYGDSYGGMVKVTEWLTYYVYKFDVYEDGQKTGQVYMNENGEISKTYAKINSSSNGNFVVATNLDGTIEVLNATGKVVYCGAADKVQAYWYKDVFQVVRDGKAYLYDENGELLISEVESGYSIPTFRRTGKYTIYGNTKEVVKYSSIYTVLENGLFVVAKSTEDGYVYGAMKFGEITASEIEDGLHQDEDGTWKYYVDGEVATGYTGLVYHYGAWFYVENGVLNWNYTGLTLYNGTWYYVEGGVLNWDYTGLTYYYGAWYYVSGGVLDWSYTGLCEYYGSWYYVEGGVLNWDYTGLCEYYGSWYYVEGGVLNWGYAGLCNYYGVWYYVEGGVLNWNYTGLVYHYGTWYYVGNGVLDWNYTGYVLYYGTWYYVVNGVLVA